MADNNITRDSKGRWVKGVSGNPKGKPIDQFKYLRKMGAAVSATEWREIIRRAVEQAKRGDPRAREWLSDYLMGKPPQQVDIGSDGMIEFVVRYADTVDGLPDNTAETP